MSIHEEILGAAQKVIHESADVSVEKMDTAATTLAAVDRTTGHVEFKTFPHGMGYTYDVRLWAKSFLEKTTIPSTPPTSGI
jgi:hypothetical protein